MRWLFWGLLMANVGLFAWLYLHQDGERALVATTSPASPGGKPLVLLSEVDNVPAIAQHSPGRESVPQAAEGETAAPQPEAVLAETPQEVAVEGAPAEVFSVPPPPPAEAPVVAVLRCYSAGPFAKGDLAHSLTQRLVGQGLEVQQRPVQVRKQIAQRILLPPLASEEAARARIGELKGRGLKDVAIIMREGRRNTVSLGVFSQRDTAEARVSLIRSLGYAPVIEPVYRDSEQYWLDYQSTDHPILEKTRQQLESEFPAIRVNESDCG